MRRFIAIWLSPSHEYLFAADLRAYLRILPRGAAISISPWSLFSARRVD